MASGKRLGVASLVALALGALLTACKFPELADIPTDAVDAAVADGTIDGAEIDGAEIDAPIDALTIDATPIDAPIDAPWDITGTYTLTTTPAYTCAASAVVINFTSFTFSTTSGVLRAVADTSDTQPCPMAGPAPTGTTFSLSCTIAGMCTETYTLMGTITGPTTFTGTFAATFTPTGGSCLGCVAQSFPVTGSR